MYIMEYYSVIKKNEIMSGAATKMSLEIILLSEVNQTNTIYHLYMKSKHGINHYIYEKKKTQTLKTNLWLLKGKVGEMDKPEFGISRYKLLHIK